MKALAALALVLAGCAAPPPFPPPVFVPEPPPAVLVQPRVPDTAASVALKRDTAAVQAKTRAFIAKPSAGVDEVKALDPLNRALNRALATMERHHTRRGYRPADVAAARARADDLAHALAAQSRPAETLGGPTPEDDATPLTLAPP